MGKYHTYHLTMDPGDRDPERVAAELRAALPEALAETIREHATLDDVLGEHGPHVWVEDGLVHYSTGRNFVIQTFMWEDLVPALPVPARWACGVWQQEVEYNGGVEVFGWVDGGFAAVDELPGQFGTSGRDALATVEREWGVTGRMEVDPKHRAGPDDDVADPDLASVPGYERVDRSDLGDVDAAVSALSGSDPERRRRAAERLYVHVTEGRADADVLPTISDALEDDATKWAAGAAVRALSVPADDLREFLSSDDPDHRLAGARFCALRGIDGAPVDALRTCLSDPDARVRTAAALAFERSAIPETADLPGEAVEDLAAAADDEDPTVRALAAVAAARFVFDHEAGDPTDAAEAFARAAFDADVSVRDRVSEYVPEYGQDLVHPLPVASVAALVIALPRRDAVMDREPPAFVQPMLDYAAECWPEAVEPALTELVALGWERDSPLARGVVTEYLDGAEGQRHRPWRVRIAVRAAGVADAYDGPELPETAPEGFCDDEGDAGVDDGEEQRDAGEGDEEDGDASTDRDDGPTDDTSEDGKAADDGTGERSDRRTESRGILDWLPF